MNGGRNFTSNHAGRLVQCGDNLFLVLSRSYGDKHVGGIRCGDYAFDQAFPQTVIGTTRQDQIKRISDLGAELQCLSIDGVAFKFRFQSWINPVPWA